MEEKFKIFLLLTSENQGEQKYKSSKKVLLILKLIKSIDNIFLFLSDYKKYVIMATITVKNVCTILAFDIQKIQFLSFLLNLCN